MEKVKKSIDVNKWFSESLSFQNIELNEIQRAFMEVINAYGFKIIKENNNEKAGSLEAIYGSKIKAGLLKLIPFGLHLPSGKRFLLKASFIKNESTSLNISMVPYMELYEEEEIPGFTQGAQERFSDDYFASLTLFNIIRELFLELGLPLPEKYIKFKTKQCLKDIVLGLLIYPLEGYKSSRRIHLPSTIGPRWNMLAFLVPEFWFMWNEIWGMASLAMLPTGITLLLDKYFPNSLAFKISLVCLIISRVIFGRVANKTYYARHGSYPSRKKIKKNKYIATDSGPYWSWGALFIPELWFLWNEMWGIGVSLIFLDFICFIIFVEFMWAFNVFVAISTVMLAIRVILAFYGNKIYYSQHGHWKKSFFGQTL